MSTHNIGFYEDLTKIIFEMSSNIIKYAPYFFCCVLFCILHQQQLFFKKLFDFQVYFQDCIIFRIMLNKLLALKRNACKGGFISSWEFQWEVVQVTLVLMYVNTYHKSNCGEHHQFGPGHRILAK